MAEAAKTAWGVDVGNCALKAIKLGVGSEGVEVLDFAIIEHEKMLSEPELDPEQRVQLVTGALQKFLVQHEISGPVVVSVPGQSSFARFIKLPPVETKRIPEIVRFEAIQQIPFDINDIEWDWQVFQRDDSPEVEVGIFAIKRQLVQQALEPFVQANCSVGQVQMAPMALYNFLCYDQKRLQDRAKSEAIITLDIGAENTDLVIADGLRVWQRNIPIGGNQFTAAVQKAFKLGFAKAEAIKRTAASSKYARQIFQAMRSVFADLAAEVQRSLGFYSSTNRDVQFREVLALGNGMKLPGLVKFLQQSLSLPVKRLDSFESVRLAPEISQAQFTEALPSLGAAYGLAIQGLGLGVITSNLLPREVARHGLWQRKKRWVLAAAIIFLLSPLFYIFTGFSEKRDIESTALARRQIDADVAAIKQRNARKAKLKRDYDAAKKRIADHYDIYKSPRLVPQLFQAVRTCLPNQANAADEVQKALYEAFQRGDRQAVMQVPRQQRHQVFVSSVQFIYTEDLHQPFAQVLAGKTTKPKRKGASGTDQMPLDYMPFGGGPMMGPPGPGGAPPGMAPPRGGAPTQSRTASAKKKKSGERIEDKQEVSGFVVVVEGSTPHQGGLGFLHPHNAGLERDKWGFFQRLRYLGKDDAQLVSPPKPKKGSVLPKPAKPSPQPNPEADDTGLFEAYAYPGEALELYYDDSEGGWITVDGGDQPAGLGILKADKPDTQNALAANRSFAARSGKAGDVLVDPFTLEPISDTFVLDQDDQVQRDSRGNAVTEHHDYWFRVKFKVKLKGLAEKPAKKTASAGKNKGRIGF